MIPQHKGVHAGILFLCTGIRFVGDCHRYGVAAVQRIADAQQAADTKIEDVANGEDNDLHGTMIAMEQASVQLRLLTTVRDRALEAYREVMRMGA